MEVLVEKDHEAYPSPVSPVIDPPTFPLLTSNHRRPGVDVRTISISPRVAALELPRFGGSWAASPLCAYRT